MRCDNQTLLNKISQKKLEQNTEVDFNLLENLPDCKKINTNNVVSAGEYTYDPYNVPENRFECMRKGCINSGTFSSAAAATFFLAKDGIEYAAGVLTFYAVAAKDTVLKVTLGADGALADADQYEVTIGDATSDGFYPVVIVLSEDPTTVIGNGWTPATSGTFIKIENADATATDEIGISSISVFDEITDFATNDVVKISCLSSIDGTYDIGALEATCTQSGYDTESANGGFDFTLAGRLMTPNYNKLNPLEGKGNATQGFDMNTVSKVVEAYAVGTDNYGKVTLADAFQNECGFISVQMADNCNVTDASLVQLMIPTLVDVDGGHYQVIKNNDGTTDIIFNEAHVGKDVLISYPVTAEVEEMVGSMDNVGNVRVRMSYVRELSDGAKFRYVYNNVLVTSFPAGITNTEEDVSFTINVQRDSDGLYYHRYRIVA